MGEPDIRGESAWSDCALLSELGIPTMAFGPKGAGLHGKKEYASVESIKEITDVMTEIALDFCK
jgi:di/tripeptidase